MTAAQFDAAAWRYRRAMRVARVAFMGVWFGVMVLVLLVRTPLVASLHRHFPTSVAEILCGAILAGAGWIPAATMFYLVRSRLRRARDLRCPRCGAFLANEWPHQIVIERARCVACSEVVIAG